MKKFKFLLILTCVLSSCTMDKKEVFLESPEAKSSISFSVVSESDNQLRFSISYLGDEVVKPSDIYLSFKAMSPIGKNLSITSVEKKEINESWERVWGKSKQVQNHCNEATIALKETVAPFRVINIIARAYDDGIAFRYQIPEQPEIDSFSLAEERTGFVFAEDYPVWATLWSGFVNSQEKVFNKLTLSKLKENEIVGTPLLIKLNNGWGALLEANLTDWAGMCLTSGKDSSNIVRTLLSPLPGDQTIAVKSKAPRFSPWRVLMLGEKPGDLIESDIIHNLNEPNQMTDVSWIHPGRSAWDSWWCGGYGPGSGQKLDYDNASMKYFIDFASEMGWEYQIVDWLWYGEPFKVRYSVPDPDLDITKSDPRLDIPYLVEYAKSKNVKLFLWAHNWHLDRQLDEAFATYEKWGIAGVKIDFMNRNDQEMVNFYHKVIKKAAEHKLLVIFHGAYMPTGVERTYPNFITREGVLGNEASKWGDKISPEHCVTLPFTRMLGGHMDFTPGGFRHAPFGKFVPSGADTENPWVQGTRCFQLAMPVIYESAVTIFCDSPDSYRGQEGLDFYKVVPTTWDESKVIDGMPGEFIIMARKNSKDWFLGAMTNNDERQIEISLDFLDEGSYTATIYSDAADADLHPENIDMEQKIVTRADTLKAKLAHGGGYAAHFKRTD